MLPFKSICPPAGIKRCGTGASPHVDIVIAVPGINVCVHVCPVPVHRVRAPVSVIGRVVAPVPG
jgi:hypothetical protein